MSVNSKIRIVWLCPYPANLLLPESEFKRSKKYHPAPWLVNTVQHLSKLKNIDLHVVLLNAHIISDKDINCDGVSFHIIKRGIKPLSTGYPVWFRLDLFTCFWLDRTRIIKKVTELNPDLVHAFGSEVPYGMASTKIKCPVVFSLQGLLSAMSSLFPFNINYWMMGFMEKLIIQKNKFFISQSLFVKKYILKYNPNATIFETSYPLNDCFHNLEKLSHCDTDIVFVGSIMDKNKGFALLLDSYIQYCKLGNKIKFAVIGSNNYNELKKSVLYNNNEDIFDSIKLLGKLSHKEIAEVYSKSKVLIVPSYLESYSMTLAEGLASGLCVIASNTGGVSSLVVDGVNGLLFESGNSMDLVSKLVTVFSSETLLNSLGERAKEIAKENFNPDIISQNHYKYYKSIINEYFYNK